MKNNFFTFLFIIITSISCSSDSDSPDSNNNGNTNATYTTVVFEHSSFSGSSLVTYSDGTTQTSNFISGLMKIPLSANGNKIIASIQPENQSFILLGRKEGSSIHLNYNLGILSHRIALNGFVPIGSYAELQLINANSNTLSANYRLEYDLDLMEIQWTPIGNNSLPFKGNFDGNNHKIHNLYVNTIDNAGLFGFATSYPSTQYVKDLIITSGSITSGYSAGGIIGTIEGASNISNCQNYADVVGAEYAGGIIGGSNTSPTVRTTISDCQNFGFVTGYKAGGIAGVSSYITNCQNNGQIQANTNTNGTPSYLGGIAGICVGYIIKCSNNGGVFSGSEVGGICGNATGDIIDCYNTGTITSQQNCGGIVSLFYASQPDQLKLVACFNNGIISGNGKVGGIVAKWQCANSTIEACYNTGKLNNYYTQGGYDVGTGGIIGYIYSYYISVSTPSNNNMSSCYNTGELNCYSFSGGTYISGGLIGYIFSANNANNLSINNCYWKDINNDGAQYAIGQWDIIYNSVVLNSSNSINTGSNLFDSIFWPTLSQGWLLGNGANNAYWKSLGNWNNGNPIYPKLHYEN